MQFYLLDQPKADSVEGRSGGLTVTTADEGLNQGPAPICTSCGRFLGSLTWLPPYRVEVEPWGQDWGDIARIGNDLIVSKRFKHAFEEAELRGIGNFEHVEVIKVSKRWAQVNSPIPAYFKVSIKRGSTAIDQSASGFVWEDETRVCAECGFDSHADLRRCNRLVISQESWDGDDIFFPRGAFRVIVSERFRSMFHENQLLGAIFILSESEDAGYDSFPWEQ